MSHRPSCPDEWTARREGERAYEYGKSRSSNPYEDSYWNRDRACRDAEDSWDRGYRRAEMRAEEEREEEAARQRAERHRAEMEAEESAYLEAYVEPPHDGPTEEEYIEAECASTNHAPYDQTGDRFGIRCYCGKVRWMELVS